MLRLGDYRRLYPLTGEWMLVSARRGSVRAGKCVCEPRFSSHLNRSNFRTLELRRSTFPCSAQTKAFCSARLQPV